MFYDGEQKGKGIFREERRREVDWGGNELGGIGVSGKYVGVPEELSEMSEVKKVWGESRTVSMGGPTLSYTSGVILHTVSLIKSPSYPSFSAALKPCQLHVRLIHSNSQS